MERLMQAMGLSVDDDEAGSCLGAAGSFVACGWLAAERTHAEYRCTYWRCSGTDYGAGATDCNYLHSDD